MLTLLGGAALLPVPTMGKTPTPKSGGTLNVGFPTDSKTFNPIFSVETTERQVLYVIYYTLVNYGTEFSF
jgi:peptide/nickel transport system substrate-binding protein